MIAPTPQIPTTRTPSHSPGDNEALTFHRDHHLQHLLFTKESFQHKARVNLYWLGWLLHRYSTDWETILDPMGGVGSILLATTTHHRVITGDIERHWTRIQAANARRIQRESLFFSAPAITCQWNATHLPIPTASIPDIITSPPYFDLFSNWNRKHGTHFDGNPDHVGQTGLCYGFHPHQVGNIHVYENYLRAMRDIYTECWRVLTPGGKLILIVGDKVRKRRIVPVTTDTLTLCQANSFKLIIQHQRRTIPSHFRLLHQAKNGPDYPLINTETALLFQKQHRALPTKFAVVEAPNGLSRPGCQLFDKQLLYCHKAMDCIYVLSRAGLTYGFAPDTVWSGDHPAKARDRREWAYQIVADLVTKHGLTAGAIIELHVTDRYARYLQQRLKTLGCRCTIPTAHCNLGQKLAWYTQALNANKGQHT